MFDTRNNLSHQVAQEARTHFEKLFDVRIPARRSLESPSFGKSIYQYTASKVLAHTASSPV